MKKIITGRKKEKELEKIATMCASMFTQVAKMLEISGLLLENTDTSLALDLMEEDKYTDELQSDIIIEVNNFIITQQPKAVDLRLALGTYLLVGDLERMGDYCKNLAKIIIKNNALNSKFLKQLNEINNILIERIEDTKNAYDKMNHAMAKAVGKKDEIIDDLTRELSDDVNLELTKTNDPDEVSSLTKIIILAKLFERSGDHLVNICEQISYIQKGQIYYYS